MRTLTATALCVGLAAAACGHDATTPGDTLTTTAALSAPHIANGVEERETAAPQTQTRPAEPSRVHGPALAALPFPGPPPPATGGPAEPDAEPPPSPDSAATEPRSAPAVVARYGGAEGPWPWIAEAWKVSKVRLYEQLRSGGDTCEEEWNVACASGTPWWESIHDLSPTGTVLHALALVWADTADSTDWDELRRAFEDHYDDCYTRDGVRLSRVLVTEAMVWAAAGGDALGEYGYYSDDPDAWRADRGCAADSSAPPPHLVAALGAALFNCTADEALIDAGGWRAIADRACPDYEPFGAADYGTGACAPDSATAGRAVSRFTDAPALCVDTSIPHTAVFHTSLGSVRVALDLINTPGTANNFVNLARFGYYDGTLFHRGPPRLGVLQGGSPYTNPAIDPGPGYTLRDEGSGFSYRPGQLVMARRAGADSAGAQFFFTVTSDSARLDDEGSYVVFGKVVDGLDILEYILDEPHEPPPVVERITIETG